MVKAVTGGAASADEAFAIAAEKALARVEDDRRAVARATALRAVGDALGALPVGCPRAVRPERHRRVRARARPDACKGCGLCVDVCTPAALVAGERDARGSGSRSARGGRCVRALLPDTTGAVVAARARCRRLASLVRCS
ncbi:MAG: hypothetical protein H6835_01885 [Planctomycetes bacterium]|nr:hypothetical protein [Planctomycetota bacterium]